jgi:hypothetical protein
MTSLSARLRPVLAGILTMALALSLSNTAHAEVHVEGQIDSVRVEVRDASVHEALAALSAAFGLRVHNSAALNQPMSGTYRGSLQQVVARLLTGRDYVARYFPGNAEIKIYDPDNGVISRPVASWPGPPVVPAVAPNIAAPAPASNLTKGQRVFAPR